MSKVNIVEHPLISHKMGILRDKSTCAKEFREIIEELSTIVFVEATRDLVLVDDGEIETPICKTKIKRVPNEILLVPILRAGSGMVAGIHSLLPQASVGHVGFYRDPETLQPVEYLCKLPDSLADNDCFVLDPMLATGGTAMVAISYLKKRGARRIKFLAIVTCPEGVAAIERAHPEVDIFAAAMDDCLNDHGYIVPGLGDAGDRIYGTPSHV